MTSIPPLSTTSVPPPSFSNPGAVDPISPLSRSGTFPHKTSPAVSTQTPLINTATPAINAEPVELDGGAVEGVPTEGTQAGARSMRSPGDEEDFDAEFLGEGMGVEVAAKRAAILASRSKDPSVIVDIPREPTAEEVHAARSAEGLATPAFGQGRVKGS